LSIKNKLLFLHHNRKHMKATPRQQIDFLKEKITEGFGSRQLHTKFKRRFRLSTKTYERQVAIARRELRTGNSAPAAFVLLNFHHQPENNPQKQEQQPVQKEAAGNPQTSTQAPIEKAPENNPQNTREKHPQNTRQSNTQTRLSAEIIAATEKLLCTTVLHTDDCLFLLTRFALGQFVRQREVTCRGEIVELNETPNFSQRRAAVNTIMKYHAEVEKDNPGQSKYLIMDPDEMANIKTMSEERYAELVARFNALD
jgi:heat shock protein HspQ